MRGYIVMETKRLLSLVRQACDKYDMLDDGDKVAVGISGGKDSLTLLYALKKLQQFYPKKFKLMAISIHLGFQGTHLELAQAYCKSLEVPFEAVQTQISEIVFGQGSSIHNPCSLCARMRKGALNDAAIKHGCNKIAYAHNRDDLIETMLLSLFYEGRFHSFPPKTEFGQSGLTLIRPLMYVPEADVIGFKNKQGLPVSANPCPADGNTKRQYVKDLLKKLNQENPGIKNRMFAAIQNTSFDDWPISGWKAND